MALWSCELKCNSSIKSKVKIPDVLPYIAKNESAIDDWRLAIGDWRLARARVALGHRSDCSRYFFVDACEKSIKG
jgi:hypothetical protein